MKNIEGITKIAVSLFGIIVPCIMLSGFSYHIGYIFTFGLSHDLVIKDISDVLVESWYVGVLALVWLMSMWPYWLGYFAFLTCVVLTAFFIGRYAKEKGIDWVFDEISKENQGKKILGITQWHWCCLGEMFSELISWLFYPLVVLSIIGLFTLCPYQKGKADVDKQLVKFAESGCHSEDKTVSCVYLIDTSESKDKVIAKGILITANDKKHALYNNKIEVWPLLDSYIIRKNNVPKP